MWPANVNAVARAGAPSAPANDTLALAPPTVPRARIRPSDSLARALARVGVPTRNHGYWETDAALDAGRVVARELEAWRGGR